MAVAMRDVHWSTAVVAAPASEPLTTAEVKVHLGLATGDHDTLIDGMIGSARVFAEQYTRRQFMTATHTLYLDSWPNVIELPFPPAVSVTTVKYTDTAGTLQTVDGGDWVLDVRAERARLYPAYGESWPSVRAIRNAIEVEYVAGYGSAALVPKTIKQAMLMLIGHYYENREAYTQATRLVMVPLGVDSLLNTERVHVF